KDFSLLETAVLLPLHVNPWKSQYKTKEIIRYYLSTEFLPGKLPYTKPTYHLQAGSAVFPNFYNLPPQNIPTENHYLFEIVPRSMFWLPQWFFHASRNVLPLIMIYRLKELSPSSQTITYDSWRTVPSRLLPVSWALLLILLDRRDLAPIV